MSGLTIAGLHAGYRRRPVLAGLDLGPLPRGLLTVLVGPNAAGKSTLLRALAGLVPATGSIRLAGPELIGVGPLQRARRVALMPQHPPQRVSLTVFEAVLVALRASATADGPLPTQVAEARAMDALARLDLVALAAEPLDRLSGGQRQLASFAQALVRDPLLLLLDEPTSALDLRHQWQVMDLARAVAREGRVVVAVLHDLALAARWADRLVVLDRGAVAAFDAPSRALRRDVLARVWGLDARLLRSPGGQPYLEIRALLPDRGELNLDEAPC